MIGSLRGILLDWSPTGEVLVEVGGVGYRLLVPPASPAITSELGAHVFLHVHTHVREDAIVLYGFGDRDQRACFEALIGTHGIGPSVALNILSVHTPGALHRIVANSDGAALTLVPGIGKKLAARLLLELKERLDVDAFDLSVTGNPAASNGGTDPRSEVRAALVELGYGVDEVRNAVRGLPADGVVEDMLRSALQHLAAAR